MHITGKEKTLAAKPVQEVPGDGWAVSGGDADVGGTDSILPSGFPEHFIQLIILRGGDAGTSPPVQTNAIPAPCRLETHVLIGKCFTRDKGVETRRLTFKFGLSPDENNGYIPV
jgi:hypothetical protein